MKDSIKPVIRLGRTKALVNNQGFTYNEAGFTYNQTDWQYGGIYEHDIIPLLSLVHNDKITAKIKNVVPTMKIGRTKIQVEDQGYTYNQAGFIYNQAGWMYGGLFEHDIYPLIARARIEKPSIMIGGDFGAKVYIPPGANTGYLVGILGLTYP